jgi:SAM-dependent methyltransferase
MALPVGQAMTDEQRGRWIEVLDNLAGALPVRGGTAVIDSADESARQLADRLADTLRAAGRPCTRLTDRTPLADEDLRRSCRTAGTVAVADGPRWRCHPPEGGWDVVVWLRTAAAPAAGTAAGASREEGADVVVDLYDRTWPVIRHVAARLAGVSRWYLAESRAFFASRAATWDTRFGDDLPAYAAAVAEAGVPAGAVVLDVGCGTGRALPVLRDAVGRSGTVIGLDLTPQMLAVARARGGHLVLADARRLPVADSAVDVVFAAGLLTHLPDAEAGLRELARVTRSGGGLILFHPSGRAALAARHGRALRPDEPLAEAVLRGSTDRTGWRLTRYDDAAHRFLAVAHRR